MNWATLPNNLAGNDLGVSTLLNYARLDLADTVAIYVNFVPSPSPSPSLENTKRHFLSNSADRPEICANRNQIGTKPATIK